MTRAVIYLRISHDPLQQRSGVERQREDCEALARSRDFDVVEVVEDNDTSAAGKAARPGFERVCRLISGGHVDAVVAWAFDRLTRNRRDQLRLIELGQEHRVLITLCRGADMDLSSPAGRLSADILASVARNEIEQKSDRQVRANEQRIAQGRRLAGRRNFGYTAKMEHVPEEAQAISDGYQWVLDGVELTEIARRWNGRGLTTPQRKRGTSTPNPWTGPSVSRCLRKPAYAGLLLYKGVAQGAGAWEPIVDESTWNAAQAVLTNPARRTTTGNQAHLLTGVALCGVCGEHTVHARGGKTGLGVYSCSGPVRHLTRKREPIDQWVETVVVERLSRPDARTVFTRPSAGVDVAAITVRLSEVRERLDGLAEGYASGVFTLASMTRAAEKLRDEEAHLLSQLEVASPTTAQVHELISADDVQQAWDELPTSTRRAIIAELFTVTIYSPGRGVSAFNPDSVTIDQR